MARVLPPELFALTRPLVDWLAEDAQWRSVPWRTRAFFRFQALLGSVNARLAGLSAPPRMPLQPAPRVRLMIVGPWRSGTTALHELLHSAGEWITPRTWQCMAAPTLGLVKHRDQVQRARPMDDRQVSADSPQEDEFAMLSLGGSSAYRGFLQPHRLAGLHATLQQETWVDDRAWFELWERFLDVVVATADQPAGTPLLLKSPNHTFRLRAMLRNQPEARFVWVARDPAAVLASNLRMWKAMSRSYGLTPVDEPMLTGFLVEALHASARTLRECMDTAPRRRLAVVAQQALRQNPTSVLDALSRWLADDPRFVLSSDRLRASGLRPSTAHEPPAFTPANCEEAIAALRDAQDAALKHFQPQPG